jgi:hypothetical protein
MANGNPAAKGVVYGQGNLGLATRVPRETTLFNLIARQEQKAAADENAKRKAAQARGKELSDFLKWSPDKAWMPYTEMIKGQVHGVTKQAAEYYKGDPTPEQKAHLHNLKTDVDANINRTNEFKKVTEDAMARAAKDPEISEEFMQEYLGGVIYDEKGEILPVEMLNPDMISSVYENPYAYNRDIVAKNFADTIPEQISARIDPTISGHDEVTLKSKFYQLDSKGDIQYDSDGTPVYNFTPEMLSTAKKSHNVNLQIEAMKKEMMVEEDRSDVTDMEAFRKLMSPQSYTQEKINREESAYKRKQMELRMGKKDKEESIIERKKLIDAVQKGHGWALDALKQSTYNGMIVKEVDYDTTGEDAELVLKLVNKKGEAQEDARLSLGSEAGGSFNVLNTVVNTIKGQERFSMEDLTKAPSVTPSELAQEVDIDKLNTDIKTIQQDPVAGAEYIQSLEGVESVEYDEGTLKVKGEFSSGDKTFNLRDEKSYEDLKKYVLDKNRDQYVTTPGEKTETQKQDFRSKYGY